MATGLPVTSWNDHGGREPLGAIWHTGRARESASALGRSRSLAAFVADGDTTADGACFAVTHQPGRGYRAPSSRRLVVRHLKLVMGCSLLGAMLVATPVFADIPPDDACMAADEGDACDNAGEDADGAGVCVKDTCTRATPDGPMSYECYLCKSDDEGTAGRGNEPTTGGAGAGGAGAAGAESQPEGGASTEGGTKATGGTKSEGGSKTSGGSTSKAGTTNDASDGKASADDDGGCSVSALPASGLAGIVAPLVAFGLALARRRRARRS